MTRRGLARIAAGFAAVALVMIAAAVLVFQSGWFREKVRESLITNIEKATGGRAEMASFQFDWTAMRVQIRQFVLHGNEPAGKPPLIRASSIDVGLKIISVLRQQVDVRYVNIQSPEIYLIVYPDGRTNLPEPKVKRRSERTAIDTLINLAIGQFTVQNGLFEVEARSRTPFSARGRNLDAKLAYELASRRYHGNLSIEPLEVQWNGQAQTPLGIQMALTIENNRISFENARVATGSSNVEFSGALEDLASPRISARYQARISAADLSRALRIPGLERGSAQLAGNAEWTGGSGYAVTGNLRVLGVDLRQQPWEFRTVTVEGALRVDAAGLRLGGVRFTGEAVNGRTGIPFQGQAAELTLRGNDLNARRFTVAGLGGTFDGEARLRDWDHFEVHGDLSNLEARRAVAIYSREQLPWNSLISGPVQIEGSTRRPKELRVSANVSMAPAPQSAAVRGQVAVKYDRATGAIELGRSTLLLPASRVEIAGAIGNQLRVHLETRDLNDFLAVLGENAASIPVKLENGSAVFDGTATGQVENPRIAGHLALTHFSYAGRVFDSLAADLTASPESVRLQNAALARGTARAQFVVAAGLHDWKIEDASALSGSGTVRNAMLADLLMLLNAKGVGATGTLTGTGQVAGTAGSPQWSADLEIVRGSIGNEPFDRFAAHLVDSGRTLQLSSGQLTAGGKQVQLSATFEHPAKVFDTGRLRFQARSNTLPIAEIRTLAEPRPGLEGTVQFTVAGEMNLASAPASGETFRLTELEADVTAKGLQVTGQRLGDVHLTANSQGPLLRAHLDSNLNGSAVRGDGEWRMEGDYPGNAMVTFSKLDLAGLREWIAPSPSHAPYPFTGFAEGSLHASGPALKPEMLKADLRIETLEIRAASGPASLVLRNSGPIVATAANSVITIERAELTGRSTDVTVGGRISLSQRNPLDLRVNGRADLGLLQSFAPDVNASGMLVLEASVRGSPGMPQVTGRVELNDGGFSYGMLPNGITNATGVILFTGDRATIQKLEGTTGGGKIQLSGFTGYTENGIVFGLHADAQQVRVRYPEGVSTIADANLNFTGSTDRSLLAGTITIQRAGVNLQADFSNLLAKSAEPVRTPASQAGFLAGVNYDIQIETSPEIEFESTLTQDIQADAILRLRGTATNPALLGRVNITQGEVIFFGTRYTINQGSITFNNPVKIEPILNIDLETRARGIDITLTIAGPLNKLNLTPRSDPPLQFNEIIALLTTGEAPATDVTRLSQQSTSSQPFQQSAPTALLGSVIANPVSGRLQRFFGISKLRINPTLDPALANGVQYNPQARLTIEQQVTPNITFTYVTNVTNANPQIVSMEWSVSKQWSVVAQREENGLVGLDFYLKKRFK